MKGSESEDALAREDMSKAVRYSMIPESYWQASLEALEKISEIERDWKSGVLSAGEAMVSIASVMQMARAGVPYIKRGKK